MRIIPTRVHGALDYLTAFVLAISPWLFNFQRGGVETWLPLVLAGAVVLYSLATAYEWGLFPVLPMPAHLALDAAGGVLLAASPWLFGFHDYTWLPHLILGLWEVGAAAATHTAPGRVFRLSRRGPPPVVRG